MHAPIDREPVTPVRHRGWLAVTAIGTLAAAGLVAGCGSTPAASQTLSAAHTSQPAPQTVSLQLQTGKQDGKSGWPRFSPGDITLTKGSKVTLVIENYDDGPAPLTAALAQYDNVQGGTETVDGMPVTSVSNDTVAHTFTVPQLGVNVVIPAAPTGGTDTVVYTFTPTQSGSFTWKCFAPCGDGSDGMGGAMATMGWMEGTVTVQ